MTCSTKGPEISDRWISCQVIDSQKTPAKPRVVLMNGTQIYRSTSKPCLALHSFAQLFINPLFMLARAIFFFTKIFFDIPISFVKTTIASVKTIKIDGFCNAISTQIGDLFVYSTLYTLGNLWEVIRTPYFAVGIQIAALQGLFSDSRKGAARVAHLERRLNHVDHVHGDPMKFKGAIWQAPWFQPIGSLTQKRFKTLPCS